MARYIDVDKAIERLNASPAFSNMGTDGYFLLKVVEDLLTKQPTADVAPKSEVAREVLRDVKEMGRCADPNVEWVCLSFDELAEIEKKYTEEDDT